MAVELALVADILSIISLLVGIFFLSVGMIGLLRLPDVYNRLHATTKVGTLGAFGVLLSILFQEGITPMGIKAFTVGLFILLTSPISGHMIARAAYRMGVKFCDGTCIDEYAGQRKD
ncbi:Na(+) H(+) antiporter subunit G [Methanosarcina sp. MTP4]|uniref:monovalent cation/H(+) antiporter subunit G n=1 Tax=Methanosarcina sp. MTP4 TaxID=1434100 RepID=UPI000615E156|nr:monovalent cation/H(+) antiporter subunit G [Methanosarcina sp. MTP4]AKB23549.1 Na(+) H(+) antiporter subunit G [Methanosarcina sp. MTP4]